MSLRKRRKPDARYKSNGQPPYHMRFGRKTMCQMTGFPSYERRLVQDDYGLMVDPRYASPDTNEHEGSFR